MKVLSFLSALLLTLPVPAVPQTSTPAPPQRDPQAIAVITKTLNAAGGVGALAAIQDFTASGTASYNWGDSPVQGNVTVKGRGLAQFRLDATLPEGVHSWVMNTYDCVNSDLASCSNSST